MSDEVQLEVGDLVMIINDRGTSYGKMGMYMSPIGSAFVVFLFEGNRYGDKLTYWNRSSLQKVC